MRAGWWVAGAVVVAAGLQTLLVLPDPVPSLTWQFALLLAASVAVLLAAATVVAAAVARGDRPRFGRVLGVVAVLVVVAVAASLLHPLAVPVVLAAGAPVPVVAAAGPTGAWGAVARGVGRRPVGYVLRLLLGLALAVLGWVAALLLGLFVTGPLAAAATWLVMGALAALLLWAWSGWARAAASSASA
ncbi:hypothetical protein [Pseudonocardia sp. N23]|uniref:hypothetical protein n=1 Tax=Pseudonocardia sp. N23 TaxID=1987376 RepID=UPI000BFD44D0|nr:hypothetical protein [Pseudonocardia sp. N23]GAY09037.1 hypothetical protein TOK_2993 [Pseudonocardia sp. N23]